MRSPLRLIAVAVVVAAVAWMAPLPQLQESVAAAVERTAPSFTPLGDELDEVLAEAEESTPDPDGSLHEHDADEHDADEHDADEHDSVGGEVADPLGEPNDVQALDPDTAVVGLQHTSDEFHTIGVTLPQPAEVLIRVRGTDGVWEPWAAMEMDSSEGPDLDAAEHSDDFATAPVWIGAADAYEVVVPETVADELDVVTVRDVPLMKVAVADREAGAATTTPFAMHQRSEWTSRAAREVNVASEVKMAVVHHTVSTNSYSAGQVPSLLRGIQAYHMDGRGWSDIGYNFVVDKYGGIWEARGGGYDRPVIGAHASGFNTGSVGISVLGDYSAITPSAAVRESIAQVAGWKLFRHGYDPAQSATFTSGGSPSIPAGQKVTLPRVVGHTHVGSTSCPGRIAEHLGSIRGRAQVIADFLVAVSVPLGGLESLGVHGRTATVRGWAIDPDLGAPAKVRVQTTGASVDLLANVPRPDLAGSHTAYSTNRGFQGSVNASAVGLQNICVTVINQGLGSEDLRLTCVRRMFEDPSGNSPTGGITAVGGGVGTMRVTADFTDRDAVGNSLTILEIDGRRVAHTGSSGHVQFDVAGITSGSRDACIVIENRGSGFDSRIDCRRIQVLPSDPIGALASVTNPAKGWIRVKGWALDPETLGAINVVAMTDVRWVTSPARLPNSSVKAPHPMFNDDHGFEFNVATGVGKHPVCLVAINSGGGSNEVLGCRDVIVK